MTMRRLITIVAAATLFGLCLAQNASAQIALDNVTTASGANANVNTLSWSHTVNSGSNRILIVALSQRDGNASISGVWYGGTLLSQIGGQAATGSQNRTDLWYLVAPPSGTANVFVLLLTSKRVVASAISFTGVNQTTPLGTFVGAAGQSTTASVNVSSGPGELVIDTVASNGDANTLTANAGQTERWDLFSGTGDLNNVRGGGSTEPGAASVTMSWTLGASKVWAIGAVAIKPAASPPNVSLVKSVSPSGNLLPGTDLAYQVTFTNSGGRAASSLTMTDPIPTRTDFKLNSVKQTLGTTGLGVTVSYSNDGGTSWTYTPVSGGGSAPAGYDRNVTNIRWAFTGNLGQTSPNNSGSIGFTTRIR
jgi:uncharacterized repeat protein (TIGR01451 family)